MIFRRITLMLILSFAACASFYAQKGWGIEGSAFLSSPYGNYIADLGVTHYWNFMKYGTIGMGAKFSYVNTSNLGEWYTDTERYAFNDDENFLVSLDGVTTIGCYIPVLKQTGVFCDASVTFSLIPIDWIDIKKYNHDNPINYELHSISAFNHFSPKTFLGDNIFKKNIGYEEFYQQASKDEKPDYSLYYAISAFSDLEIEKLNSNLQNATDWERIELEERINGLRFAKECLDEAWRKRKEVIS